MAEDFLREQCHSLISREPSTELRLAIPAIAWLQAPVQCSTFMGCSTKFLFFILAILGWLRPETQKGTTSLPTVQVETSQTMFW